MKKNSTTLSSLGLLANGTVYGTPSNFDPRDLIGCVPTLVVRDPLKWVKSYSALGIYPFAKKESGHTVEYACATENGSTIMIIASPNSANSPYYKALIDCGVHFSELTFFCSGKNVAANAMANCLRHVTGSRILDGTQKPGRVRFAVQMYRYVTYSFLSLELKQDALFLEGYKPFPMENLKSINLGTKLDHIVQNVPEKLYGQFCNLFDALGFVATFDGADTVEFATRAFAPPAGIFDRLPFFAFNTSQNDLSQINVGIKQHGGPFIQHIALHVNDYASGAKQFTDAGIAVMGLARRSTMGEYYTMCKALFQEIFPSSDFEQFQKAGGLFDHDCEGTTTPLGLQQSFFRTNDSIDLQAPGKLTCFFELIQRSAHGLSKVQLQAMENLKGACAGFGKGNFGTLAADVAFHAEELGIETKL